MFSLESLHRGDSNEYQKKKKHTIFNINRSAAGAGCLGIIRGNKDRRL